MSRSFIGSRLCALLLLLLVGTQIAFAERTTTYFHTDGLGSVVAASDQSGAVLWRKSYAPYGEQIDAQPDNERLSYTGKPHDDAIGLTYFGGRYYDPSVGRFASVDPVGFVESNPMSFNRYLYVNNNPYKYVDPDGEFLNFAAKFVLDVGVNMAINYVTTGEMDVGGALKDSAVGLLNPAKTVANVGKLAMVMATASKASKVNWKSVRQFGHVFNEHGAGVKNTKRLTDRARGTGKDQGQWLDNEKAAEALGEMQVDGVASMRIPQGLGQVIKPDGSIVKSEWAKVVPKEGGLRSAYPIDVTATKTL